MILFQCCDDLFEILRYFIVIRGLQVYIYIVCDRTVNANDSAVLSRSVLFILRVCSLFRGIVFYSVTRTYEYTSKSRQIEFHSMFNMIIIFIGSSNYLLLVLLH